MEAFDLQKALDDGGRCLKDNGNEALIIKTDANMRSGHSLIVLVKDMDEYGKNAVSYYHNDGTDGVGGFLKNIPNKFRFERWVNLYKDKDGGLHIHKNLYEKKRARKNLPIE